MPLFVKTMGRWKAARSTAAHANSRWNESHRVYVCVRATGVELFSFDASNPPLNAVLRLDGRAVDLSPVVPVRVTKASGGVFFARILSVDDASPDLVTITWTADTANAPASAAELAVPFFVTQWRTVLQSAALPGSDEVTTVPVTTGGDRSVFSAGDTECVFFGTPGVHTFRVSRPGFCSVVLVGGGGGGGGSSRGGGGGGGGGGRVVYVENHWLDIGDHDVVVGAGGRGGVAALGSTPTHTTEPAPGSASSFRGYVALGGGAGGLGVGGALTGTRLFSGKNGGSGGSGGGGGSTNWTGNNGTFGGLADAGPAVPDTSIHAVAARYGTSGHRGTVTDVASGHVSGSGGDGGSASESGGVSFSESGIGFVPGIRVSDSVPFSSLVFGAGGAGGALVSSSEEPGSVGVAGGANLGAGGGGARHQTDLALPGGNGGSGLVYVFYNTDETQTPPGAGPGGPGGIDPDDEDISVPSSPVGTVGGFSGGERIQDIAGWDIYLYRNPGTYTMPVTTSGRFDILLIGGGGGGGCGHRHDFGFDGRGGPGGAGGMLVLRGFVLQAGDHVLRVGAGGRGGYYIARGGFSGDFKLGYSSPVQPVSGESSSLDGNTLVARGGGCGGNPVSCSSGLLGGPNVVAYSFGVAPGNGGCGGADGYHSGGFHGVPQRAAYDFEPYNTNARLGGVLSPLRPMTGFDGVEAAGSVGRVRAWVADYKAYFESTGGGFSDVLPEPLSSLLAEGLVNTPLVGGRVEGGQSSFLVPAMPFFDGESVWSGGWGSPATGLPLAERGPGTGGEPAYSWGSGSGLAVGTPGTPGLIIVARRLETS